MSQASLSRAEFYLLGLMWWHVNETFTLYWDAVK